MSPWDNTKTRAEFVNERPGCLLGSFCPECGGDVADDPIPDRIEDHELVRTKPVLCLYCGLRMTYADPTWLPYSPGGRCGKLLPHERIKAIEWTRVSWQLDEEKKMYLMADVVDQVLDRMVPMRPE